MDKIIAKDQPIFAIAMAAYGVEGLICAHLGLSFGGVPWILLSAFREYVTRIALMAAKCSGRVVQRSHRSRHVRRIVDLCLARPAARPSRLKIVPASLTYQAGSPND
jgi:hypothetical protein